MDPSEPIAQHEMKVVQSTIMPEVFSLECPVCGRHIAVRMGPEFVKIVLVEGDPQAIHLATFTDKGVTKHLADTGPATSPFSPLRQDEHTFDAWRYMMSNPSTATSGPAQSDRFPLNDEARRMGEWDDLLTGMDFDRLWS